MEQTLRITGLSNDGRGVCRVPGEKITFVAGALPGERIAARLVREKQNFREAETVTILEHAPHYVPPACPHADVCGGCPLMRMDYAEQLVWKGRFVAETLMRTAGHADAPVAAVRPSPATLEYRNRVELAFTRDDTGRIRIGMRRRGSHGVVPTPNCAIMPARARHVLAALEKLLADSGLSVYSGAADAEKGSARAGLGPGCLRFCQLRLGCVPCQDSYVPADTPDLTRAVWVLLLTSPCSARERRHIRDLAQNLLGQCPDVHTVIHEERRARDMLTQADNRVFALGRPQDAVKAPEHMSMMLGNHAYLLDAADFFQVNDGAAATLLGILREHVPSPGSLIDLYCGCGAPGLSLTPVRVLGVEYAQSAVRMARHNAACFGVPATYCAGDAGIVLQNALFRDASRDTVLCDPPRAGMDKVVRQYVNAARAQRLVYVSCNPASLARDLKELAEHWRLESVTPVDLFPHTPHVESVAVLHKRA